MCKKIVAEGVHQVQRSTLNVPLYGRANKIYAGICMDEARTPGLKLTRWIITAKKLVIWDDAVNQWVPEQTKSATRGFCRCSSTRECDFSVGQDRIGTRIEADRLAVSVTWSLSGCR